jgi:hypothetical protein
MARNFFLDIESDSLDTDKAQILQLAIIDEQGKTVYARIFGFVMGLYQSPEASKAALRYNGTDPFYSQTYRPFDDGDFSEVKSILKGHNTWAHNAKYDSAVLEAYGKRYGLDLGTNWQCTMELACNTPGIGKAGQTRMKLPMLIMESISHDALDDVRNCWKLWQQCNGLGQWDKSLECNLDF